MRDDLAFLASPALEGRSAGTPGSDTAANFIARRFADLGLIAPFHITPCTAELACRLSYFQLFRSHDYVSANVAAVIRGTDSAVVGHYVAVTAHYDHIGRWSSGPRDSAPPNSIHPGADDNASGTAAVLELARRLSANPPARSVIVIAFGAEELGLVGSRVFVDEPPIALKQIDVVLNLDMVGRLRQDRLRVYGVEGRLKSIVERANVDPRFSLLLTRLSTHRSDDYSFSSQGVPALHFSTGEHIDYHRVTDTVDRIELAGLVRVIDYVERVTRAVAR